VLFPRGPRVFSGGGIHTIGASWEEKDVLQRKEVPASARDTGQTNPKALPGKKPGFRRDAAMGGIFESEKLFNEYCVYGGGGGVELPDI
jgi:hypothetical protein